MTITSRNLIKAHFIKVVTLNLSYQRSVLVDRRTSFVGKLLVVSYLVRRLSTRRLKMVVIGVFTE